MNIPNPTLNVALLQGLSPTHPSWRKLSSSQPLQPLQSSSHFSEGFSPKTEITKAKHPLFPVNTSLFASPKASSTKWPIQPWRFLQGNTRLGLAAPIEPSLLEAQKEARPRLCLRPKKGIPAGDVLWEVFVFSFLYELYVSDGDELWRKVDLLAWIPTSHHSQPCSW